MFSPPFSSISLARFSSLLCRMMCEYSSGKRENFELDATFFVELIGKSTKLPSLISVQLVLFPHLTFDLHLTVLSLLSTSWPLFLPVLSSLFHFFSRCSMREIFLYPLQENSRLDRLVLVSATQFASLDDFSPGLELISETISSERIGDSLIFLFDFNVEGRLFIFLPLLIEDFIEKSVVFILESAFCIIEVIPVTADLDSFKTDELIFIGPSMSCG
mmetsp:Transcript_27127/g.32884  ORF Transcript_27127/g.32884 Transcript_27127/m.32884 type:complete len:217 (+) Transcript_27127:1827-2477(+)